MRARLTFLLAALALVSAGCGDDEGGEAERPGVRGALGGSAETRTLARARLPDLRPAGRLSWIADEVRLAPGQALGQVGSRRRGFAFIHVQRGAARLEKGGRAELLRQGDAAALPADIERRVTAGDDGATLWEIRLAAPGSGPPPGANGARRIFESPPLEGIPARPIASFIEVALPPRGGETTVHTHPGPEFIYMTRGRIDYQNAIVGTKPLGPGGAEGIPPGTAVQKRNPFSQEAVFLSWFLVDPDKPFAPRARFQP